MSERRAKSRCPDRSSHSRRASSWPRSPAWRRSPSRAAARGRRHVGGHRRGARALPRPQHRRRDRQLRGRGGRGRRADRLPACAPLSARPGRQRGLTMAQGEPQQSAGLPAPPTPPAPGGGVMPRQSGDLGDILERVLDKGIVIAGDIQVNLLDIELLTIRLRLIVASVDTRARDRDQLVGERSAPDGRQRRPASAGGREPPVETAARAPRAPARTGRRWLTPPPAITCTA